MSTFDWELSIVTKTTRDENGFLLVQELPLGADNDNGSALECEVHQPWGISARPHDPENDADGVPFKGCSVWLATEGNNRHAMLGSDPRVMPKVPPVPSGGFCSYGSTSNTDPTAPLAYFFIDSSANGSSSWMVPHKNATPAASSAIQIDVSTPGGEFISCRHGLGHGIAIQAGDKNPVAINNVAGDAGVICDDDGVTLNGTKIKINGACLIGDPATAQALALAVPLLAWITSTLIPALGAAAGGPIVVAPPPPFDSKKAFAV